MQQLESYFEAVTHPKENLYTWRKRAWDRFLTLGLPRPKQEDFQYISLKDISIPTPTQRPVKEFSAAPHSLLFVDGFFQGANLPTPLVCMKTNAAMLVYGIFLQNRLSRSLQEEKDPFALMNGALYGEGAFLYVPPNTKVEMPIEIHHYFTTSEMSSPRLQIFLARGASVQIVERTFEKTNSSFCNSYFDISLDANASLFLGSKEPKLPSSLRFSAIRSFLKKDSKLHFLSLSEGAKLSRTSLKVELLEENSEALLQGLTELDATLQSHSHVTVEHKAPNCRSKQHFKGVLREKSRSSFEGKIYVHPIAQKTEAYQLSNQLLLSDEAETHAKPNLEIFADDVKASHGATISQLNKEELFYFQSRGISLVDAKEALIKGFCEDIIQHVPSGITL